MHSDECEFIARRTIASAALAVGLVVYGISGASADPGDPLRLGVSNTSNVATKLIGKAKSAILSVTNTGAGPALSLTVPEGKPPMKVSTGAAKVKNLDADKLDGRSANQLVRAAVDADDTISSPVPDTDAAIVTIDAPTDGFVMVSATVMARTSSATCSPCFAHVEITENGDAASPLMIASVGDGTNKSIRVPISASFVFPASAGSNVLRLRTGDYPDGSPMDFVNPSITALFVPFDGTGKVASSPNAQAAAIPAGMRDNGDGSISVGR